MANGDKGGGYVGSEQKCFEIATANHAQKRMQVQGLAQLGLHGPSRFGFGLLSEQELEALANAPRRRRMEKREEARARCLASREAATEAARQRLGSAKAAADKAALSARLARRAWIEALLVDDEHEGPP